MSKTTLFRAKRILTMDSNRSEATHVAVRDGIVLAVGGPDCADGWGAVVHDDRFAEAVMLPGLIEAHAHVMAGGIWGYAYVGHYARADAKGHVWPGIGSSEALIVRLRALETAMGDEAAPLVAWGFDPNCVDGPQLDRHHLDGVSKRRPVVVLHSNLHLLTANTTALARAGIDARTTIEGVARQADGSPSGVLQEFAAMGPVLMLAGVDFASLGANEEAVRAYGEMARRCGVTTVADLLSGLDEDEVAMLTRVTGADDFPVRYVPIMNAMEGDPEDRADRAVALARRSTDKLRLGRAKLFTDGAIQGFTAKLKAPGYFTGEDRSIWNMEPDHFRAAVAALHRKGVKTHVHANGDAASAFAMDAFEAAMRTHPNVNHRHTLEHAQLADRAQFKRMRALGLTVNLFANHVHYFGDIHLTRTLGPDRAMRMNACADALEVFGGDFAIHSDAPVTPMAPLFTAWCAVNRLTATGRRLGETQRIPVEAALRCITLGAAHVLKLDDELGSIATGRRADFCLLDADPLAAPPEALKDIAVIGTVLAGRPTAA